MKGVRWGLVAQTVAMFSFLTIGAVINRDAFAISYINGREFTGADGAGFPGPIGYQSFAFTNQEVVGYVAFFMFPFNQWLADGLLVSSVSNSAAQVSTDVGRALPAVSLLCYLFDELLGHRLPISHVPRLNWYVLESLSQANGDTFC